MRKIFFVLVLLQFYVSVLIAQNLFLNEVVTQNNFTIADLSGNKPDWIEIYNPTNQTLNLKGYGLSDEVGNPRKWTFKNGTILPDSFIVVFASDLSHDSLVGAQQVVEDITNIGWAYGDKTDATPGTSEVTYTLFNNSVFGLISGKNAVAGKIYLGPAGALGYSYAGVHIKFKDWDVAVNRSGYDMLRVRMYLEKGKKANFQFAQTGLDNWLNYTTPVIGTGDTSWYEIPLKGDLGRLDLSKLTGLSLIAPDNSYGQSFEFVILNQCRLV